MTAAPRDAVLLARLDEALAERAEAAAGVVGLLCLRLLSAPTTLTLTRTARDGLWEAMLERTREQLRTVDILVRADPHACWLILPRLETEAQVMLAARKVAQALDRPCGAVSARGAFGVGAAWSPAHGRVSEELIRSADVAADAARRQDKAVVFFDERLLAAVCQEAAMDRDFFAALDNGELTVHIQPQVDLQSGACVGGELLLRWADHQGRQMPPAQIPDVARRLGAIPQLTRWLVFAACRLLSDFAKRGLELGLSVNLVAANLMDDELPFLVRQACDVWRVPPSRLTFELVETGLLEDPETGAAVMQRLIDLGVSTAIDDFGIGYSSILYLRQLPLGELKIDRAFVGAMAGSSQDRELVAVMIRLAHALGLRAVAEGVEDAETLRLLRDLGCDRAQGYWIGRAMPAADLPEWVAQWAARDPFSRRP